MGRTGIYFNFLTGNGVYRISEELKALEEGTSEYSNLFFGLNKVLTEVRLKTD